VMLHEGRRGPAKKNAPRRAQKRNPIGIVDAKGTVYLHRLEIISPLEICSSEDDEQVTATGTLVNKRYKICSSSLCNSRIGRTS